MSCQRTFRRRGSNPRPPDSMSSVLSTTLCRLLNVNVNLVYYITASNGTYIKFTGDVFIPTNTNAILFITTLAFVSIAMAVYVTPWILIPLIPVVSVFSLIKMMSNVSIRQLKRIENTTRSPLISHVNVTSQGLSTIVGYKQQHRFFDKYDWFKCSLYISVSNVILDCILTTIRNASCLNNLQN